MKTITKHILLLALMLFGAAGASWAQTHNCYGRGQTRTTVDISELQTGDTLYPGFTLTRNSGTLNLSLKANRYRKNNAMSQYAYWVSTFPIVSNGDSSHFSYYSGTTYQTFVPVCENGQNGNAWAVTGFDGSKPQVAGVTVYIDPSIPVLDETTGNWNFLMPGANKLLNVELLDSIVLGPHVTLAQHSWANGTATLDSYTRGDSTVIYYEPGSLASVTIAAAETDGNGKFFAYWADLATTDPQSSTPSRDVYSAEIVCGHRYVAVYPDNYTLTLNANQGGTLTLDGYTPGSFNGWTINVSNIGATGGANASHTTNYQISSVSLLAADNSVVGSGNLNAASGTIQIEASATPANVSFNYYWYDSWDDETYSGTIVSSLNAVSGQQLFNDGDDLVVTVNFTCTANGTPEVLPYGVTANADGSFSVMEGLELGVTATPDSAHYLSAIDGQDTVANAAVGYTFEMPSANHTLAATFTAKPVLTLAHNEGGAIEAIVPQGEPVLLTTIIPTATAISTGTWTNDTVTVTVAGELEWGGDGWIAQYENGKHGSVSVTAAAGVDIAYCKFYSSYGGSYIDSVAPYAVYPYSQSGSVVLSQPNGQGQYIGSGGVARIEVYTPSRPNVIASSTPNTYYIDYGTDVTVMATPDRVHYLANFDGTDVRNSNVAVDNTFTVTADTTLTANFATKPVLTLAAQGGGTLEIAESVGTFYTITFDHDGSSEDDRTFTIPASRMPYDTTFSYNANVTQADAYNQTGGSVSLIAQGDNWVTVRISGAFEYYGYYSCNLVGGATDDWDITCKDSIVPVPPTGISKTGDNTYRVDYGTEVTLNAEATAIHHVAGWQNEDNNDYAGATYSNYAITTPQNLFPAKSSLTFTVTGDTTARALFGINSYDVTASVAETDDLRGTVSASYTDIEGQVQSVADTAAMTLTAQGGSTTTLTATPAWGYHFTAWLNANGDTLGTNSTMTTTDALTAIAAFDTTKAELAWSADAFTGYTMIDFNNWAPTLTNSHNVEVRYGCAEGTLTVDAQSGAVGAEVAYGHVAFATGTFHIYAVHDLSQEYFYDSVAYTLTVEHGTIVSLSKNIDEGGSAVFADQGAEATLTHCYTNGGLMAFVAHGNTVDFEAEPATGYHFTAWQEGNLVDGYTDIATDLQLTYTTPNASTAGIKAVFDTNVYSVTYTVQNDDRSEIGTGLPMGSVVLGGRHMHFLNDTLTVTAAYGYTFAGWADQNGNIASTENPFIFSPTGDVSYEARFEPDTFSLATTVNNVRWGRYATEGTTPDGNYPYLSLITLTAEATIGNHFDQWSDEHFLPNEESRGEVYTFQLTQDTSIEAIFGRNFYNVSYNPNVEGRGTITCEHPNPYRCNYIYTTHMKAHPAEGYTFDHWTTASGVDMGTEDSIDIVIMWDTAIIAVFVPNPYSVTALSASETMGATTGSGSYDFGTTATLTATANYGYHFTGWSDGVNTAERTITVDFTHDTTVTANFAVNQYTVTAVSGDNNRGTAAGTATVDYLATVEISATANAHYHFTAWDDHSTDNPRTVTATANATYTALFAPDTYTITGTADQGTGYVNGSATVEYQTPVTLTAVPVCGYRFDHWSNGATTGTITVTATADTLFTAYFRPVAVDTVEVHDTTVVTETVTVVEHDTTVVTDTVTLTEYVEVPVHDTTVVEVEVEVEVPVHDTTYIALDTMYINVPDTNYGIVEVFDTTTTVVYDSIVQTIDVTLYDTVTTVVYDSIVQTIDVTVYDTTTVDVTLYDTTTTVVYDSIVQTVDVTLYDTTTVDVTLYDTTITNVPVTVYDTTVTNVPVTVYDTTVTNVDVTVYDTTVTNVPVTVYDTTVTNVPVTVYDTTITNVPVTVYDTTITNVPVTVYDTTVTNVPVTVYDTTITNVPVTVYDTTVVPVDVTVYDTTTVDVTVYDTTTVTVPVNIYDTTHVDVTVVDSTLVPIHDTITVTEYVTDTVWLTEYIHDTIVIHDTVYIIVDGIEDTYSINAKIYSSNGQIVVEGAENNDVVLYDVTGRVLGRQHDYDGQPIRFDAPASGSYLVRIGNHPARRVVLIR